MGPTAVVLLNYVPGAAEVQRFERLIEDISPNIEGTLSAIEADKYGEYSDEELKEILRHTGLAVRSWYSLGSPTNGDEDHEHLGRACLAVARAARGLVDFGGALLPELPSHMLKGMWLWEHAQWSDIEPYFSKMAQSLPGNVFTVPYQTAGGGVWASHICDVQFMEAWLTHPSFRMIK